MFKFFQKGQKLLTSPQNSVMSAAAVIMLMIVVSRILGLVRQRILAHFFVPTDLSLFFAAFRLPDLVFEVLVFGTFSSAFIPVFTRAIKDDEKKAWDTASYVVNIGILVFVVFGLLLGFGAPQMYGVLTPGFTAEDQAKIVSLTRVLFAAQGFFVVSYVLTGVLESLRRFLIPALAPLFYNLGIIVGTVFLSKQFGLNGPVYGVVLGAFAHFAIQLPLAYKMGFRFKNKILFTPEVRRIGKLALPRVIEVSFLQVSKMVELFFSSLISKAAYTYFTFGNSLQLLPVGIFGTSIAKAALPSLATYADDHENFKKVLFSALYDMAFFVIPISTLLIVLRVPIVRLVYGTDIFTWEATIQTGYVLSAFAIGVFFQSAAALLARSFYALHDTRTPVVISILSIILIVIFDYVFVSVFKTGVWGLALSFTIGSFIQSGSLFVMINKRVKNGKLTTALIPIGKSVFSAFVSGSIMFILLKFFDRYAWIKRLSFLGKIEIARNLPFEKFVLDTRYTINLIILTFFVSLVGLLSYIVISMFLKSQQVWNFFELVKRILRKNISPIPKEQEPVSSTPTDATS